MGRISFSPQANLSRVSKSGLNHDLCEHFLQEKLYFSLDLIRSQFGYISNANLFRSAVEFSIPIGQKVSKVKYFTFS